MNEPEVTPWFDASVIPARIGDYQVQPDASWGIRWSHWDGKMWSYFVIKQSYLNWYRGSQRHDELPWRGLASDPDAT